MTRSTHAFAFYGRVSTEDQQDPASSRAWQLRRSHELIDPHEGQIVAEFFDVGQSRSIPWKRRPEASKLLELFPEPDRGFDAVVIGEPQRAFYGAQFALTFPLFEHYGIELWTPEIGGPVDAASEAHDLVMTLFGGMSKGERSRIRTRVRNAMAAQAATEGRFLGGRPPYGYRLADAGPHPNQGKAALGARLHQLEPDPVTAPIVVRIFEEYVGGRGLYAIAERLTREDVPSPSAYDRQRNPHRNGNAWSKSAIRAILMNPRYTGLSVWGRQRREEILLDVDDVAAGHRSLMRWNDPDSWIRSRQASHKGLISPEMFDAVQARRKANSRPATPRSGRRTVHTYLLRGLFRCGFCDRRMQGTWNHSRPHYRCSYPTEYALDKGIDHPRAVYIREDQVVPELDRWIAKAFEPDGLEDTCRHLSETRVGTIEDDASVAATQDRLRECDERLAQYREALDAGADPAIVAGWIRELQAERRRLEHQLRGYGPAPVWSPEDIRRLVDSLGDVTRVLRRADPEKKADLYASLGLGLTYLPDQRKVRVEVDLTRGDKVRVGGGI
jgi:site-specific DNA recombinase